MPEEQVRLDEVLVDVGDKLFYAYDFGDNWRHVIRLEAVLARDEAMPSAVCTGGRRPGPAEDCGGIGGYELLVAATDPTHPDHVAARAEWRAVQDVWRIFLGRRVRANPVPVMAAQRTLWRACVLRMPVCAQRPCEYSTTALSTLR